MQQRQEAPVTDSHGNIIKVMAALGYPPNPGGVCQGIAFAGMNDFFNRGKGQLDSIINDINKLATQPAALEALLSKIRNNKDGKQVVPLTIPEANVLAFFESVIVAFNPKVFEEDLLHKKIVRQTETMSYAPLYMTQNKSYSELECFTGVYEGKPNNELIKLFTSLRQSAVEKKVSLGLMLGSIHGMHGISVSYDCKQHKWSLTDASQLPSIEINDDAVIAKKVFDALTIAYPGRSIIDITTQVYALDSESNNAKAAMQLWKETKEFVEVQAVANGKQNSSWIYFATKENDLTKLVELLENKADPNRKYPINSETFETPLFIAVYQKNIQAVNILLNAPGIDPDLKVSVNEGEQLTALSFACRMGYNDIAKTLLLHGADPNIINKGELHPLYYAIITGNLELADLLLNKEVNTKPLQIDFSPFSTAILMGNLEMVKLIWNKMGESISYDSITAGIKTAIELQNEKVLDFLLNDNKVILARYAGLNQKVNAALHEAEDFLRNNSLDQRTDITDIALQEAENFMQQLETNNRKQSPTPISYTGGPASIRRALLNSPPQTRKKATNTDIAEPPIDADKPKIVTKPIPTATQLNNNADTSIHDQDATNRVSSSTVKLIKK